MRAAAVTVALAAGHVALAACHAQPRATTATGTIAGIARDRDSGDAIAMAEVRVRAVGELATARRAVSNATGQYDFARLAPGRYSLSASFAGQPIDVENIDVRAGGTAIVDVTFTRGKPDPVHRDWGDPKSGAIDRYRPRSLATTSSIIEGTVNDSGTHLAVAGAVVTAIGPGSGPMTPTLQTISDDRGRYRFDAITPGTYVVSAYYDIGGRGAIEIRRSDIHVAGAEAVVVPLWVELAKQ